MSVAYEDVTVLASVVSDAVDFLNRGDDAAVTGEPSLVPGGSRNAFARFGGSRSPTKSARKIAAGAIVSQ